MKEVIEGFELSPQQKYTWQLQGEGPLYSQCAILLEGALRIGALKIALEKVVQRNEILRTTFDCLPGMDAPIQTIFDEPRMSYREIDFSDCDPQEHEARIEELLREAREFSFDFQEGPLAHFSLVILSASKAALCFCLPALCADSRTLKNLYHEIVQSYEATLAGEDVIDEPLQYIQFSEWQNELLEAEGAETGKHFWDEPRANEVRVSLPFETIPSSSPESVSPECLSFTIERELAERLDALAELLGVSQGVLLLTCWQALLWRLTGETEITVHTSFDGRKYEELHSAMGLFTRYAPVQTHISENFRFSKMLKKVNESTQNAYMWLEYFIKERSGESDGYEDKQSDAIGFDYEQWPEPRSVRGVEFSFLKLNSLIDRFKLRLAASRCSDSLALDLHFLPSSFSLHSVNSLASHLLALLQAVADDPDSLIDDLQIISEADLHNLLFVFNHSRYSTRPDTSIVSMFQQQVLQYPDRIAVGCLDDSLTFHQLNHRANQLAHYLIGNGVTTESLVGICLTRSPEMIVSVLGIWKAGAAYIPLDPRQPSSRLAAMIEDANPSLIIMDRATAEQTGIKSDKRFLLDEQEEELSALRSDNPEVKIEGNNLAYVIYTSGSTGQPKGVMIEQASLLNLAYSLKESLYQRRSGQLRVSVNAPLAFDASIKQLIQVAAGHCLEVVPEEVRSDAREMVRYIREQGIEVVDCTPSQLKQMLEEGLAEAEQSAGGSKKAAGKQAAGKQAAGKIVVGGEAIDEQLWERLRGLEGRVVYNVYGPTECCVDATAARVGRSAAPTIGKALTNVEVYILDDEMRAVPAGVEGELYIGGAGVGRGYLRRAELTAEKFVPHPYSHRVGARLYRTGDVVRYNERGEIEYIGRADNQVKVRGYRVELGEIEAALRSKAGVKEAVAVVRQGAAGGEQIVGYVVVEESHEEESREDGSSERKIEAKRRYRLPNGQRIEQKNRNETEYLYEEIYEKQSYLRHGVRLPERGVVVDVGANIGMFTMFVGEHREGVKVYAIEPIEEIYESLVGNVAKYGERVKALKIGLGEESKQERYRYYEGYTMMSGVSEYASQEEEIEVIKKYLSNEEEQGIEGAGRLKGEVEEILAGRFEGGERECEVKRLSEVIREEGIERIELLKIDVQRAEEDVLRGIEEEDWEKIEQVVMELHDREGGESEGRKERVREELKRRGFRVEVEQDEKLKGTDRYNLYAVRGEEGRESERIEIREEREEEELEGKEVSVEEIRKYVRGRVPEYMVPGVIVKLEELPLTRNGKVDRAALPLPEEVISNDDKDIEAPHNIYEELLVEIWAEVLKVEHLSIHDNFFDLGGHSLLATQVMSRMRDAFNVEIPLRSLFQAPTVAQLAPLISDLALQAEGVTAPALTRAERTGELALSFAQQRLWFLNQLEPDSPFYNCPMALRLDGKLNHLALGRAIAEMIDRHEVLRTSFPVRDGKPVQQVGERGKFRLPVIDLTEMIGEQKRKEVERLVAEEGQAAFDLSRGPLVRAKLIRESDEEHVIAVTMHHIVSDAWSKAIVVKEVAALYEAYSRGEQSPLEDLLVQYGDYAVWQREWLQGEVLEAQLKYWREQLEGAPQMMEIATDRVRPAVQSYRGAKQGIRISKEVSERLKAMSRREGVTMYMSLLAGFKAMLMRYSGQTDIVVGTSIAGRNRLETEELIGFFVNTLVMRTELAGDPTFKQLLRRVREVTLGAYTHQDIPFEKVVEELHPDRDLSRSPLFQITFAYQNATEERQSLTGVNVSGMGVENATAKFDLTLSMAETAEGILAVIAYNTDLYEAASIERMLRHLERLIASGVAEPERRISELSMLSEQEERMLLLDWNDTRREFFQVGSIIDLFEAQVEQTPDAVALVCEDQSLSYKDLNRRANQLAHYLISIGVGPEVKVGLCVDRTVDMIVAVVGVLKAGGAYVAIDPTHPKQRVADMLEDARAAVLLTQDRFIAELSQCDGHKVCLDSQWEMIAQYNDDNPINGVNLSNPAYVIYTSGSTGMPKGVIVEHQQLLNYVKGIREVLDLEQGASYASVSTIAADLGNTVIYPALCGGGTLHVIGQERVADAEALAAYFGAQAIDCLKIVPSHLAALMSGSHPEQALPCRRLVLGGESVSWEMIARIGRLAPELKVINHYGPTETTVGVLTYEVGSAQAGGTGNVPLGRPIANGRVYVLGEQNEAVPVGVTGELYIGGSGVARGYLNRPDLTAERFLPDPFSIEPGARLYRSGDRARLLPDGNVEFLGRIDNQVKIRGFRIELGEIESALSQHEAAEQVAVIAKQDAAGDKRLVAYIGHCHQPKPDANELQYHLKNRLPEYMIPSAFVILETLPLMANGKIDRKALPAPTLQGQEPDAPALPRTWQEELLVEIWAEVLKVEHLSIHDNFFELGGHSLLATQVMSRMRDAFNVEIPLRSLFQAPTVAQLAPLISDLALQAEGVIAPALTRAERTGELALSFAQQRLWFLNQLEPDSPFYNCPMALRLDGKLNQAALGRAIAEMIDRHEVLRTSFPVRDGKPVQQVGERGKFRLPVIDLTEMSGEQKRKEVERLVAEEGQAAFDLSRGPLVRAKLIRESDEEHVIAVTMHHIVSDAWSKAIVVKEVAALYEAYSRGEQSPLEELRVQYGDYAVWQREWLQGEVLEAQLKYWREQLEGAPQMMEIATDRVRPAVQSYRGAKQGIRISKEVSERLKAMSRREGVTMYMSLLAGFKAMLMRYSGQTDIVVGTSIAGRNRLETEELIGFFVNTLVMRTELAGDPTFKQLLRRVREVSIEAFSHQEIPFERIVEELQPERDLSRSPLFQILFEFQSTTEEKQSLTGVNVSVMGVENATAKFDLTLSMAETAEGILAVMVYNTDLYEAASIERMLRHLERLIASGVAEPEKRISELSLLNEQEERLLLLDWNDTEEVYADEKCMHELFEDQAARTPDAVAISSHDGTITYDELNRRSNRLARTLIDRGTGSEVLVGLLANRGIDFLTAFLAVMKAGGACLAFDPSHPSKRHQQILTQSNCTIVIAAEVFMPEMLESIEHLPELERTQVFSLEELLDLHASDEKIASSNLPNNLAYVSYTSGSTGVPKGAMIEHRGMLNHLLAKVKDLGLTASDTVAQNASQSFDISVWQSLAALLVGGRVHIIGDEVAQDPLSLAAEVDAAGISILETVPTLLRPMLELLAEKPTSQRPSFSTLRWLISNAEALPPDLCRAWFALYPEIRMLNTWGATECSDDVTHLHIERLTEDDFSHMPLGFPLINIQRYIVDENMNPVPIGIPGEICIAGISVGRGYMNEAKRTAERFLPNPFSQQPGQRLYKTGDLGRFLHDGNIEFLGRLDHQVKIRGFRIELSEIEAALALHPSIAQPLVLARQDHNADKRLVAYFSCSADQQLLDASELRAFLKLRLPDYMIPAAFVQLDSFPLTSNGKIDRAALPAPDPVRLDELAYKAPRSEAERILADIWQQVLRIEKVSVTDNFFELGGDSILSIQIIARANQRGLHLTARQMFQHQTVEELAEVAGVNRAVEAEQGRVSGDVPLTPIQRWFFEQEIEDRNHFNQSVLFEVDEEVRADWIEEIVGLLLEHHDALRMRYSPQAGGEWKQTNLVEEHQRVYEYLDLSQIEEGLQRAAIERACEQAQESLNIQQGPMIRVVQMGLGEGRRGRLLIVIHHLVVDGVSWRVLLEEIQSGYEQKQRGEQIRLTAKTTSFKRWAEQMAEQARSEWMREEEGYWKEQASKRVRRLPVDKVGGENTRESARVVSAGLSKEETEELLKGVAETYHTQINEVLMMGLVEAIGEWVGERRVRVEMEGHGREEVIEGADVTRTVGWFTSVYPVVVDVEGVEGVGEELREVKEQMRRIPRKGIGYGMKRYLGGGIEEEEGAEVSFNYLGQLDQMRREEGWLRGAAEDKGEGQGREGKRGYLIEVNGAVKGGQMQMHLTYSEQMHEKETIERVAERYMEGLRRIIRESRKVEATGYTPSDFPKAKLSRAELEKLLSRMSED